MIWVDLKANCRIFLRERGRQEGQSQIKICRCRTAGFEDGGKGQELRAAGRLLTLEKEMGGILPQSCQKPCRHLAFSLVFTLYSALGKHYWLGKSISELIRIISHNLTS